MMDTNEAVVIMSAVRYMLGRSSYGVGSVIDHVKEKMPLLAKSRKEVIISDIEEYFSEHDDEMYKTEWLSLVSLLKKAL